MTRATGSGARSQAGDARVSHFPGERRFLDFWRGAKGADFSPRKRVTCRSSLLWAIIRWHNCPSGRERFFADNSFANKRALREKKQCCHGLGFFLWSFAASNRRLPRRLHRNWRRHLLTSRMGLTREMCLISGRGRGRTQAPANLHPWRGMDGG